MAVKHFDLLSSPLDGTHLIEASAGTGKTYTITGLFIRLLLEKKLAVDQILVVTFTEAATQELIDRIRSRMREAVVAFESGESSDPFLNALVEQYGTFLSAREILNDALRSFDQVAIFTIHGFCNRMLLENAFESGSLFDTELVKDQEDLKREIVEDFWRRNFYEASPLFVNYAFNRGITPDKLYTLAAGKGGRAEQKIIPRPDERKTDDGHSGIALLNTFQDEARFAESFAELTAAWEQCRSEVATILLSDQGLNRNKYRKGSVENWLAAMDTYLGQGAHNPELFSGFEKFTTTAVAGAVKKGHQAPRHFFFDLCQEHLTRQTALELALQQRLLGLKFQLFDYIQAELSRRKHEKNIRSFDDLLLNMRSALFEKDAGQLAERIRTKYRAALIDEFQDTDPVQYDIFNAIFNVPGSILFLIGDPKQAIYGFRGADIFAYMNAARTINSAFTLTENWRSEPSLIRAVNTIFENAETPFVFEHIPFLPVKFPAAKETEPLTVNQRAEAPLQLWFLSAGQAGGPISKTAARQMILPAVVAEIARILNLAATGQAHIGSKRLEQGDIAVLVRRNSEAQQIKAALADLNIAAVISSDGNLFDSEEALELERVLAAIARPNNENLIRGALATDMLGLSGEDIEGCLSDEVAWEEWLVKFRAWHDLWHDCGFIQMFKAFMYQQNILRRQMAFPDGERRGTNLLHLMEVLHQFWVEKNQGTEGLLKWLAEQMDTASPRLEEYQLRLESDENAVQIVTIHKSKGMEYPVVFCPFNWDGSKIKSGDGPLAFHDPDHDMQLTLDLGSKQQERHRLVAEKELLAENLRLLYVALTRARNRCYLVWGRINEAETSAPAYLFHQPCIPIDTPEMLIHVTARRFLELSDEDVLKDLIAVEEKSGGTVKVTDMPCSVAQIYTPPLQTRPQLVRRKFSGKIDRAFRISSFSALVSGQLYAAEQKDRDVSAGNPPISSDELLPLQEASGIFAFPRGAKPGTFLHEVFETLDFSVASVPEYFEAARQKVAEKLKAYGFDTAWQDTIVEMVQRVLNTQLVPERGDFKLKSIQNTDRLNELEFYFPLKPVSADTLSRIFAQHAAPPLGDGLPERIERLDFLPLRGFMRGFIDMVFQYENRFYLVDWKSNFLGSRIEDYGQEALKSVMIDEFYVLQYHIYAVALHQYLTLRMPGYRYKDHFGGVFYIFLRGVDPDCGLDYGIYRDKPPAALIDALCEALLDNLRS